MYDVNFNYQISASILPKNANSLLSTNNENGILLVGSPQHGHTL